jgi:hypothetical protein
MGKHFRVTGSRMRMLALATMVASALMALSAASSFASEYSAFTQCPTSNPVVIDCIVAVTESGEFTIGNKTVPIKKAITLQGGLTLNAKEEIVMVAASNGETLSKTALTVPGGLIGIEGLGGEVTATAELAGPASNVVISNSAILTGEGTALSLPLKLKLGNPILGPICYGGSNSHPIVVNLTTGTTSPPKPNEPISGKPGTVGDVEGVLSLTNNSLVNNSFAAPGVEGCGFPIPYLLDPLVDLAMGVPAAEGHNTAILNGTIKIASAAEVKAHLG